VQLKPPRTKRLSKVRRMTKKKTKNFEMQIVSLRITRLCRNIIIELSLNPSLEKRGTFTPFSSIREGGKGVELLNFTNCDTVSDAQPNIEFKTYCHTKTVEV